MSVTIAIPPDLEQQLRADAARKGESLEEYITQMLVSRLSVPNPLDVNNLTEDELLQRIKLDIQPADLDEYYRLVELRKKEQLVEGEYEKLLALTNRIEIAHAERMNFVIALANLLGISPEDAMLDLGIQKRVA